MLSFKKEKKEKKTSYETIDCSDYQVLSQMQCNTLKRSLLHINDQVRPLGTAYC